MRWCLVLLVACRSEPAAEPAPEPPHKPPDEMDEKMRHCPLALPGAASTLEDVPGGVRFTVTVPQAQLAEARRRAQHIVEFAARHTRAGHGEFDGKGGGRMKNCPVVTDGVRIVTGDLPDGVRLDVTSDDDRGLRAESRRRAAAFPYVDATITVSAPRGPM